MRIAALPSTLVGRAFGSPVARSTLLKHVLRGVAITFVLVIVVVAVTLAVVLSGPTEIGIVRDRIAAALVSALGDDYEVSVGRAVIDVDPVYGLVLEVENVAVRDRQGAIVANVPSTRLDLDPSALLTFNVDVPGIELNNAEIAIVRADNGDIYLGNPSTEYTGRAGRSQRQSNAFGEAGAGGFTQLLAILQTLDRGVEPAINRAASAGLTRFSFNNGTIEVWDAKRAQQRRFPRADLTVIVDPVTTALRANLATSGHGGRWTAEVERDVDASSGARVLSAQFSQLTLADILPKLGQNTSRVTADIPLYGRASVHYDSEGLVENASIRLDFGAGVLRFAEGRESVLLDEATVKLRWDVAGNTIVVEPSTFFFGETRGVVVGTITPEGDPAIGRYRFDLESRGAILAPRDSDEEPLIAQRISVTGLADVPGKLITFDDARVLTAEGSLFAAGSLGFEGRTPSLAMAASITEMPIWAAKQLWVPFLAPGARRWFVEHVNDGRIASGSYRAAIPSGILWTGKRPKFLDDMIHLNLRLEDVAFTTMGELPPIVDASGIAVLRGSTFGLDLESGVIKVPSGKTVNIDAGAFAVANTAQRHPEGVIEMQLSGDAAPLGEIADAKPFEALSRQSVAPSDLSGTAEAAVSVRLPLRPDVTEADVDWRVSIDGTGLGSETPLAGRTITDADVNILVTPIDVTVHGTAKIDGVAADIDMNQPIAGGELAGSSGQQMVRLNLDDAARKRLGIGLSEVLAGSVATYVSNLDGTDDGQHYDLDLKRARLVLPGLGWSKGIGVPASLSFDLVPAGEGFAVENLVLEGEGFGFVGTARLDSSYGLTSAEITKFALRAGDSLSFTLKRSRTGYAISARGESFDMRGLIKNLRDQSDGDDRPDLEVDARFDRIVGFNQEQIQNGRIEFVSSGGVTRKMAFSGKIGSGDIVASYTDNGDAVAMSIVSPEGGRVMRFADMYSRIGGGNLNVRGNRSGRVGPLSGRFELTNFAIVGEPAMARVVSSTSSPRGGRSGVDPNNVRFDRLIIDFAKTDQSITVVDALLGGTDVGATFNGRFDLASSNVSINGTYLPAYQFNNLFGRLPIIGFALGGGASEGLIGVTFKIEGTTDEPRLFVNPLSVVAPGIFRKIFEFQ